MIEKEEGIEKKNREDIVSRVYLVCRKNVGQIFDNLLSNMID